MQNQKMPYLILDAAFFAAFPSVLYMFPSTPLSGKPAADSRRQDKFFRTAQIRSSPEPSASPGYPHVYQPCKSLSPSGAGYPVDNPIGLFIQPSSALDNLVGRFIFYGKVKGS